MFTIPYTITHIPMMATPLRLGLQGLAQQLPRLSFNTYLPMTSYTAIVQCEINQF